MATRTSTVSGVIESLAARLGPKLRRHEPLAPYTTYRVGGPAAAFVHATSLDDLAAIAAVRAQTGVPVLVIGRGSNMLVADTGFDGIAVSIAGFADSIELPPSDPAAAPGTECRVVAGGAVALPVLARRTAAAGITGFEWAVGVPGSIGGAVRMNAGGHGSDMASCLESITAFDLESASTVTDVDQPDIEQSAGPVDAGHVDNGAADTCEVDNGRGFSTVSLNGSDIGLRFRASALPHSYVVLDATLRLRRGDAAESEREISEVVRWRREHQPGGQNCGSVFVNPVPGEVTAGALIDGLGLRGFRIGTSWVSDKHANFIQASEGGVAADVRAVMEAVRQRVAAEYGYVLRSEVRLVGFDDADPLSFDEVSPIGFDDSNQRGRP